MKSSQNKTRARRRRALRVRKKVQGTAERPRMSVFRSLRHTYVQFIDDERGVVMGAVSTRSPAFRDRNQGATGTVDAARLVGELAAEKAREINITDVVFDRGGYKYHGRVKAVAEAARSADLKF